MGEQYRPTVAKISLANFRHNVRLLQSLSKPTDFFCPMIKANAYGHGDIELGRVLIDEGIHVLGLANLEEAIHLRDAGIDKCRLLVFQPVLTLEAARKYLEYRVIPVLSLWQSIELFEKLDEPVSVHLKFNTGMSRLGFPPGDAAKLKSYFSGSTKLKLSGVCSHLLAGEDWMEKKASRAGQSRTAEQFAVFTKIFKTFSDPRVDFHLYNSAALVARKVRAIEDGHTFGSRPGISLYGIKPELSGLSAKQKQVWQEIDLRPVMSVNSVITLEQKLKAGETVSYGGTYRAKKPMSVGVVPVGYADGFMRLLSNKSHMLCAGKKVPVTGTVCMDFTMIDLSGMKLKNAVGEPVVILGEQGGESITAMEQAKKIGTNPYEILTSISHRVPRVYV